MAVHTLENGNADFPMAKVLINLYKLGIFKVKGEKPRIGYFEDNVLASESKQKAMKRYILTDGVHRDSLILAMIPEVSRKRKLKRNFHSEKKSQKIPNSTSSTMSFMGSTAKRTWRSRQK